MRNVKPCANWQCGCSGKSLRTRSGQLDRMIDLIQASDRAFTADKNDLRAPKLAGAIARYNRLTEGN